MGSSKASFQVSKDEPLYCFNSYPKSLTCWAQVYDRFGDDPEHVNLEQHMNLQPPYAFSNDYASIWNQDEAKFCVLKDLKSMTLSYAFLFPSQSIQNFFVCPSR